MTEKEDYEQAVVRAEAAEAEVLELKATLKSLEIGLATRERVLNRDVARLQAQVSILQDTLVRIALPIRANYPVPDVSEASDDNNAVTEDMPL
jgi:hypothetical protein